jgi:hypothetical protein
VTLRIQPDTGMLASGENPDAILESFMTDHLPTGTAPGGVEGGNPSNTNAGDSSASEPIF